MIRFPRIADNIEINQVEDGYVIYQADQDRVHYLNKSAVVVLESCTGENTLEEIERILQEAFDLPEVPKKEVAECLESLYQEGLIQ
jgi:UDP-N-acetyl-D-mannosaminuronate dehydrogenase